MNTPYNFSFAPLNVGNALSKENFQFNQGTGLPDVSPDGTSSYLGTAVLSDLNLTDPVTGENIRVDTALFTVNQAKRIVKTAVQGRDGDVKEYISLGDYSISCSGMLLAQSGKNPKEVTDQNKVTTGQLISIFKKKNSLKVNSWFLNMFGIYDVVIEEFNFNQNAGEYSVQPFSISMCSDTPFELIIDL